ncbi:hypothetical protein [Microvirga tunisiensis]|uniref:Uncharacterized protein n=1 Tax=Microvirga tunisiensis TaxID=2108360 RepID=A0A5N7MZI2_9HYPH|nr:hypothetical protein [Microvirga tunisiensis]MPR13862.1 hypothetical protein [Microvirga tunisiensis]MPR31689.1 hypothetical protein [Microvirga tunisiensis]
MAVNVLSLDIDEPDRVAIAEVDNRVDNPVAEIDVVVIRTGVSKVVERLDVGAVDPLVDPEDVLARLEVHNSIFFAGAAPEFERVVARTAEEKIVSGAAH